MKNSKTRHQKLWGKGSIGLISLIATLAAAVGGGSAVVGTKYLSTIPGGTEIRPEIAPEIIPAVESRESKGFTMGEIPADEPIDSIKVSITVGTNGEALEEQVNVHLGVGFPLRLFPLGGDNRTPAFAAFPQESTVKRGINKLEPGETATFEFVAREIPGQDELNTTPQLFKGLTVGDLQTIGFASQGNSTWELGAYKIEVNQKLFAENDSVNLMPVVLLDDTRDQLDEATPEHQALLTEIANLEAYVSTGLATPADKAELAAKKDQIKGTMAPLTGLAEKSNGQSPWFVENAEGFKPSIRSGQPVKDLEITLISGGGEQPGTKNPLFLAAGHKKYLLTSETDPFFDESTPQVFRLDENQFKDSPLTQDDLKTVGIGVIGNEQKFGDVPDRAKLQRISLKADGAPIYDSEQNADDRRALSVFWLIPPAHINDSGQVVKNIEKPDEKYLWVSGTVVPDDIAGLDEIGKLPEPLPPGPIEITDLVAGDGAIVIEGKPLPDLPDPLKPSNDTLVAIENSNLPEYLKNAATELVSKDQGGLAAPFSSSYPDPGLGANPILVSNRIPPSSRRVNSNNPFQIQPFGGGGSSGGLNPSISQLGGLVAQIANVLRPFIPSIPAIPGTTTSPAITISDVDFAKFPTGLKRIQPGDQPVITFSVTGPTAQVSGYGVSLLPCLPDLPGGVIPGVPTNIWVTPPQPGAVSGGKVTLTLNAITDPKTLAPLTAVLAGLGRSAHELHFRPAVTAFNQAAVPVAIGGATTGPMMPLFPANSFVSAQAGSFHLSRGPNKGPWIPTYPTGGSYGSWVWKTVPPPAFQAPSTFESFNFWWPTLAVKPSGEAFRLWGPIQGTMFGETYAYVEDGSDLKPAFFNSAVRTNGGINGGTNIRMIFEGSISNPKHPGNLLPLIKGYRLVGSYGFIGNATLPGGPAQIGISVELSGGGFGNTTIPLRYKTIDTDYANNGAVIFSIENDAPISVARPSGMFPLDIPIDFDLIDISPNLAALAAAYAANGSSPISVDVDAANSVFNPVAYNATKANPLVRNLTVTATVFANTSQANATDSLGVFGLRLVPDFR